MLQLADRSDDVQDLQYLPARLLRPGALGRKAHNRKQN